MYPGRLTSLLQPLDDCINQPFEADLKYFYLEWMVTTIHETTSTRRVQNYSLALICEWILATFQIIWFWWALRNAAFLTAAMEVKRVPCWIIAIMFFLKKKIQATVRIKTGKMSVNFISNLSIVVLMIVWMLLHKLNLFASNFRKTFRITLLKHLQHVFMCVANFIYTNLQVLSVNIP